MRRAEVGFLQRQPRPAQRRGDDRPSIELPLSNCWKIKHRLL